MDHFERRLGLPADHLEKGFVEDTEREARPETVGELLSLTKSEMARRLSSVLGAFRHRGTGIEYDTDMIGRTERDLFIARQSGRPGPPEYRVAAARFLQAQMDAGRPAAEVHEEVWQANEALIESEKPLD